MKTKSLLALTCTAAFIHPAIASDEVRNLNSTFDPGQPRLTEPAVTADVTTMSAEVTAIDKSNRLLRLKSDDGRVANVAVGPGIANFDNLEAGDTVNATFTEAVAVALKKGGETDIRQSVESGGVSQRRADGKPALSAIERKTVVANVFEIKPDENLVTLRGTDGDPVDYRVTNSQLLENLDEGDQVVMSYVQSSAIAIEEK